MTDELLDDKTQLGSWQISRVFEPQRLVRADTVYNSIKELTENIENLFND
jgi:hypothetical protein